MKFSISVLNEITFENRNEQKNRLEIGEVSNNLF